MENNETDRLVDQAIHGDESATAKLLARYQSRLKQMIRIFLDPRVSPRVDPSDILQETLTNAAMRIDNYHHDMPGGFYPWLRQIAKDRIIDAHRRHLFAAKRSVARETREPSYIPEDSASQLADRLVADQTSPSRQVRNNELREKIFAALKLLPDSYCDVLLMRYMEQLSIKEISAVLNITESAAKSRLWRALEKMNSMVGTGLKDFK